MRNLCLGGMLYALLVVSGCQPSGGSAIRPPSVDPAGAAAAAITAHDADGDGKLSEAELASVPGLLASIAVYDTDGDKSLSADEISMRLESMVSSGVGLLGCRCTVLVGGQPLPGATVRLLPEEFLGGAVLAAEGVTDRDGSATLAVDDSKLPEDQRGLASMQPGVYRVEITHPDRTIPERYNSQTTLGHEVHPAARDTGALFRLDSK